MSIMIKKKRLSCNLKKVRVKMKYLFVCLFGSIFAKIQDIGKTKITTSSQSLIIWIIGLLGSGNIALSCKNPTTAVLINEPINIPIIQFFVFKSVIFPPFYFSDFVKHKPYS